jgi:superfamily II RNA helicase
MVINEIKIKPTKQQIKEIKILENVTKNNSDLYELLLKYNRLRKLYHNKLLEKKRLETYKDDRYKLIGEFLLESNYIDGDDQPTEYGKMAALINECNPFVLTEIFTGNILQALTPVQIVCLLSIFTDKINKMDRCDELDLSLKQISVDLVVKDAIEYIEDRIKNYTTLETNINTQSDENYWELSYDYLEISKLWTEMDMTKEDHSRILQKLSELDEYEGSFIKNMLKINNIVGNLLSLCKSTQNLDLLPVLQEIEKLIIKGMVNVDSLHVTK